MESKIKALDRGLLIKATKTLLYIIPIIGLTNKIYVSIYGEYELNFNGFINFAEKSTSNLVVAFLIFSILFLVLHFIEQFLLPIIFIATNKSKLEIDEVERDRIGDGYTRIYGLNFLKLTEEPFIRFEMVSDIAFFFIIPILWLTYWNNWVGYIIIAILCALFFAVAKGSVILFEPKIDSNINEETKE